MQQTPRATGLAYHYIHWDASDSAPIPSSSADEQGEDEDVREINACAFLLLCGSASINSVCLCGEMLQLQSAEESADLCLA